FCISHLNGRHFCSLRRMQNGNIDIGTYGIWTGALDMQPSSLAREAAAEVEELGFSTLWIPETVFREVFLEAALLLEATDSMKVATGIANRYARDPLTTNAAMQTLNEAYPGRFLLGLGVSHGNLVAGVRKHTYDKPYSAMVEYLDAMDSALFMAPKGEPPAEMVLAALGPKMLKLAAERTAGAHPYFVPPEHTAIARETMGPEPLLAVEQMVVLDEDPTSARETARAHMAIYLGLPNYANNLMRLGFTEEEINTDGGSDRVVDAVVAWGGVEAATKRVQEHLDAGADHVCIQVLESDMATVPTGGWRRLADALPLGG
ncbi:MAG: LLM class F420-dependent oxidoreductase, partial [Microthrixaceae bacterium]